MTYRLNKSDPFDGAELPVEEFSANGPIHPISSTLSQTSTRASTSLLLYGRGHPNYGERIAENMVHLLENFSGATEPKYPINGQIWACRIDYIQTQANGWYQWDSVLASWVSFTPTVGTPNTFNDGEFWFDGSTLKRAVDQPNNPLSQTAISLKYNYTDVISDPNAAGVKPAVEVLVYDNGSWVGSSDVYTSPIEPTRVASGKMWYDTITNELKIYVNGNFVGILGGYLTLSGGTMTGDLDMDGNAILNIPAPSNGSDPTTKDYVDNALTALSPATTTLDELQDVDYVSAPSNLQVLKWNSANTNWQPSTLNLSDIADLTITGVVPSEFANLTGLTQNINTKFSSLDTQVGDRLSIDGSDPMTGNLSMYDPVGQISYRVRDLAPPVNDADAATKKYIDDEIDATVLAIEPRYVSLTKTSSISIPDGLTPTSIDNYTSSDDPYGIAPLTTGTISMSGLTGLGTEVMVKLTAHVKWSSVSTPTGVRGIEIVGTPDFKDIVAPLDGFDTTQYITTGPFSVGPSASFSLQAFQNSGSAQDIEYATLTFEIVKLDSA